MQGIEVEAGGVSFHCVIEGGDGAPWVTLAHSIAADHSFFDAQAEALAERFRVLRFDARGHGRSGVGDSEVTLELLARDVAALWDALGIARSHFVGLSLGGMTGIALALMAPERVERLVIANTRTEASTEFTRSWDARIALAESEGMAVIAEAAIPRWFTAAFIDRNPDIVERVRAVIEACPPRGFADAGRAIRSVALRRRLGALACPTLFIAGAEDPTCAVAEIAADQREAAGVRLVVLPAAAHISNLEQPRAFNAAVLEFLSP